MEPTMTRTAYLERAARLRAQASIYALDVPKPQYGRCRHGHTSAALDCWIPICPTCLRERALFAAGIQPSRSYPFAAVVQDAPRSVLAALQMYWEVQPASGLRTLALGMIARELDDPAPLSDTSDPGACDADDQ